VVGLTTYHLKIREVSGTGSGSCSVACFDISGVEPSGSAVRNWLLFSWLLCVHDMFEGASSSDSNVDRYVIVRKLLDSSLHVRWKAKFAIQETMLNTQDFSSIKLYT
jgi:hypothetical protein